MTELSGWRGKRVLLTGHTGFKGAWLSLWLTRLGAEVHGLALDPETNPNMFSVANVSQLLASDHRQDIRDAATVKQIVNEVQPEVVFHLAAQPLVQFSYNAPLDTYSVNVMGTAHVLDALRFCDSVRAAVIVTTDKCYENRETLTPYHEGDRLGGFDPYSSSKACTELVAAAYRSSYFLDQGSLCLATARAGNVIGGGDWATDRLIPDCIRSFMSSTDLTLRYPEAVRPWQHVLESIHGYVLLAEHLLQENGSEFAEAWNFGPEVEDMKPVGDVVSIISNMIDLSVSMPNAEHEHHEAGLLKLDSSKAKQRLSWHPQWALESAIEETVKWYRCWIDGDNMLDVSLSQIEMYSQKLSQADSILTAASQ